MSCQKLDKHSSISGCKCICIWHVKNFNIQKVTLFILIYHFTTHLTSHFLFFTSYPTLFVYLFLQFFLFFLVSYAPYLSLFLKQPSNLQTQQTHHCQQPPNPPLENHPLLPTTTKPNRSTTFLTLSFPSQSPNKNILLFVAFLKRSSLTIQPII